MSARPGVRLWVFVLATLWPAAAAACSVCGGTDSRGRAGFLWTTAFLSLLPLGMIGSGLVWLRRGGLGRLSGEFEDRDAYTPPPTAADPGVMAREAEPRQGPLDL